MTSFYFFTLLTPFAIIVFLLLVWHRNVHAHLELFIQTTHLSTVRVVAVVVVIIGVVVGGPVVAVSAGIATVGGLAGASASVIAISAGIGVAHVGYEQWLGNFQSTNFVIIYATSTIPTDSTWKLQSPVASSTTKTPNSSNTTVPNFIIDLAVFLESAFNSYAKDFDKPKTPIVVKVDSTLIVWKGDRGANEWVFGRIYINSTTGGATAGILKATSAHELFHSFQYSYYSVKMSKILYPEYLWWLEASADWAANNIAWPALGLMGAKIVGNVPYEKQLQYPLAYVGTPNNLMEDIEYDKAFFIDYLVKQGIDAKKFLKDIASSGDSPILFLYKNLRVVDVITKGLPELYRDYSAYFLLSGLSPVASSGTLTTGTVKNQVFDLSKGKPIEYPFKVPIDYSSFAWGVKITGTTNTPKTIYVSCTEYTGTQAYADIYILRKGKKKSELIIKDSIGLPYKTLYKKDDYLDIVVEEDDEVYVLVSNVSDSSLAEVTIELTSPLLSIDPAKIENLDRKLDYTFKANLQNIPKSVKTIKHDWDFGDGKDGYSARFTDNTANEKDFEVIHTYPSEGDYTLSLQVFDATKAWDVLLAEATVSVSIKNSGSACGMDLSKLKKYEEPYYEYYFGENHYQGPYKSYWTKTMDGKEIRTYLRELGCYKDGYKVGFWTTWYSTGIKATEGSYNETPYKDEHWIDKYGEYKEILYQMGGSEEGPWAFYYENGQISSKTNYLKGEEHGEFLSYYPDGTLSWEGSHNMGEGSGVHTQFNDLGIKTKQIDYQVNEIRE